MPKVGICNQLPFSLILRFDWQQQFQARCIYEPNVSLYISVLYECIQASRPSISCISSNELSLQPLDDVILPVALPSLFHTDTQLISKASHSLPKVNINSKNIYSEHQSNETLNAVTFTKNDSQSIHVPEEISLSKDNKNYLLKVPNYEQYKIEEPANDVKPLNERENIKMVKSNRCDIRENRPKVKPMLAILKGNETRRKDPLQLLTSARAEPANNVWESHLANKRGFKFHRHLHSFEPGDLVFYDWPKQCNRKLKPMFKGPLMIARPVGVVCYEIKSKESQ
ncbi:hypothetical protein AVEN_72140-1 [Araneus ventricosus]|uniref:Uncharacterized protein n=1 Tax=Araneus ventricosus TaxID=182803 RepID=A0A4Y2QXV6_ARAVE|nr:hypothetical protein AVEN_72140-1 [Araneus ventricosus]